MAKTPEGKVKDAVKRRLEDYGVFPFIKAADMDPHDVAGVYWMPTQGQFAVQGVHDIVGCWHGRFFSLETKAPDNPVDATANQLAFQAAATKAGGMSLVGVRSITDVDVLAQWIEQETGITTQLRD